MSVTTATLAPGTDPISLPTGTAPLRTVLAAGLSAGAALWMAGGVFAGSWTPRLVALSGVLLGTGLMAVAVRRRSLAPLQFTIPLAGAVLGAALTAPYATGAAGVPALVLEAVRQGGLLQTPVPFDPGWRFVLALLGAALTGGAAALADSSQRPRLAVLVPLPVTLLAGLVQPPDAVVVSALGAVVLVLAAASIGYGAELGSGAGTLAAPGAHFEAGRLARSGALALLMGVALIALNHADILFPQPDRSQVVPATRPRLPPPVPDQELFRARLPEAMPVRLGVIDVYDAHQSAWLLPPYDPHRLRAASENEAALGPVFPGRTEVTEFSIVNEPGHDLPTVYGAARFEGAAGRLTFDPRTQVLRRTDRLTPGLDYRLSSAALPSAAELSAAPPAPAGLAEFTAAPRPPDEVRQLLLHAPANPWDRLQYIRYQFYSKVVAAGPGVPVDLPPARVVAMLAGGEATPYEITAAETLLARWSGLPARIGYGYFGGTPQAGGWTSYRPADGATWLEAYFPGHGWVPIVGVPAQARASTSQAQANHQPIRPSDNLSLILYVTVASPSAVLLYEIARYYALWLLLPVGAGVLAWALYPALLKPLRRWRRRRWAGAHGLRARVGVAYADYRDSCIDFALGDRGASPLTFLSVFEADEQHRQAAWLVTRALWGDLARDLREADVLVAEALCTSLRRRLAGAQPILYRLLAAMSRDSLRAPYSVEVPNLWWPGRQHRVRSAALALSSAVSGLWPRRAGRRPALVGLTSMLLLAVMALAGCGTVASARVAQLPSRLVPDRIGALVLQRETTQEKLFTRPATTLVREARVYVVRDSTQDVVEASVQVSEFKPEVAVDDTLFKQVQSTIGVGNFKRVELPGQRAYRARLPEQFIYLWFLRDHHAMVLVAARAQMGQDAADTLFRDLVAYQHGAGDLAPIALPSPSVGTAAGANP